MLLNKVIINIKQSGCVRYVSAMKRVFLVSLSLFLLLYVNARVRTVNELQSIASATLQKGAHSKSFQTYSEKEKPVCLATPSSTICIYGYPQSNGFVVMTTDDKLSPVLGYSNTSYNSTQPASFKWWLEQANIITSDILSKGKYLGTNLLPKDIKPNVEPLIKTKWGQYTPFNEMCPRIAETGIEGLTGCIATAMSQILKYYSTPIIGKDSITYKDEYVEGENVFAKFEGIQFDFDEMTDRYDFRSSEKSRNAVAKLMFYCGAASKSLYENNGTSAISSDAAIGLQTYFDVPTKYYHSLSYLKQEWSDMIYRYLSNGHPLLYSGNDSIYGGHAFVIDGYNEKGFVSVNWGWEGEFDGFYDLSLLNPNYFQFSQTNDFIYINPNDHAEPSVSRLTTLEPLNLSVKNSTIFFKNNALLEINTSIANFNLETFNGKIALIAENEDGKHAIYSFAYQIESHYSVSIKNPGVNLDKLSDGTYRVYIGTKSSDDTDWIPTNATDGINTSYKLVKERNSVELTPENDPGWISAVPQIVETSDGAQDYITIFDTTGKILKQCPRKENFENLLMRYKVLLIKDGKQIKKVSY